ncbi:MAG: hypothetical protein SVV80_10020 [Planctomycetota bacterium]|nr:hypothetical protein [Planctomycetota bacterium]
MIPAWHNLFGPVGSLLAVDDDGGIINILVLVVMLILGLIGHIIKKAQEKKQIEQADRRVEEAKRRHAQQVAAGLQKADSATRAAPPRRPPPPPPPPARQAVAGVKQQPVSADLAQGVREEVRKVRRHITAEETDRSRRLARVEVLKSGIGAEQTPADASTGQKPKIRLNLSNPKAARTAIICAEILGPPKALRSDPEPWEL